MTDLLLLYKLAMRLTGFSSPLNDGEVLTQTTSLRNAESDKPDVSNQLPDNHEHKKSNVLPQHITVGKPWPMGVSVTATGCNVAVYSQTAQQIWLCLFDEDEKETDCIPLPACTHGVWHGHIDSLQEGQNYGFRASGPYAPERGLLFDEAKLLIDPYAKLLTRTLGWQEGLACDFSQSGKDTAHLVPKSRIYQDDFDWDESKRPDIAPENRVIYEIHVKGFTQLHPDVPEEYRGTYLGLCSPAILKYLKSLGVTTLQLMPCFSFMTEPRLQELGLTNYWGYNPINFFVPDWRYALENPVTEFKTMMKTLHEAGFEVILDVVYNHSAEGEGHQAWVSYKGLDNLSYYLQEDNDERRAHNYLSAGEHRQIPNNMNKTVTSEKTSQYLQYANYSGCGNSFNIAHPQVRDLVLSSLRYWVEEMHLDGFRFDLAVSLGRDPKQFDAQSRFLTQCQQDPVLRQCLLVAEPWDIGPDGYQLGQFLDPWFEVNDKFRDDCRSLWRGDTQQLGAFCTRLMGSRDVFCKVSRPHLASVNCVTYHDGFTLEDLVSYEQKHNQANCENNADGHGHNLSKNHGIEGVSSDPDLVSQREKHKRNLLVSLLISRGTPHLLAGDEIGRTQQGNNNAYCQDNEISWQSWEHADKDKAFFHFCQQLIALRKAGAGLNHSLFADECYIRNNNTVVLQWLNASGETMSISDWHGETDNFVALYIHDPAATAEWERQLLLLNPGSKDLTFFLPAELTAYPWSIVLTTQVSEQERKLPTDGACSVGAESIVLLSASEM